MGRASEAAARGARCPGLCRSAPCWPHRVLLFGGQEAIEHVAAGHGAGAFLGSPAVWVGLAAQVVTALLLVLLLRASATAGARLAAVVATRAIVPGLPVSGRCHAAPSLPLRSRLVAAVASRGPPALSPA